MRRILTIVVVVAATIALAWWVAGLTGTVGATIAGYTITTTTPVAIVALVIIVLAIHLLLSFVFGLLKIPARMRRWRARRRRIAGEHASTQALVAIAAGDAPTARAESARARRLLGDTPQTLLHAAEAARLAGNDEEASILFRLLADREDAGFLGLRGLFRQAMARKDWNEAAALGRRAEALRPGNNWLRSERSELAVRTQNWQQALALAGPDSPTAAFAVAAAQAEPNVDRAIRMAGRAWKDSPDFVPAALVYATKLRESGRENRAQSMLRDAWKRTPHPDIAKLALAGVTDPKMRLQQAGKLAQANPGHPESFFLIAQLALAAGEIPEARRHAEAARNAGLNQHRLFQLIANIDAADKSEVSVPMTRSDALRLATSAEADPGWRCEACGTPHESWMPVCPICQTPGRITWTTSSSRPKLIAS
jgi:HemY protein